MRRLGKTNLMVNEIGLGGIPIQRVSVENVIDIVDELISSGVNLIDTARGYTVSEEYLGKALASNKGYREQIYLCTKSMSRTYEEMKRDIQISLKNLQTDYIDLYQFHNVKSKEEYDRIMNNGAFLALQEAQAAGVVRHIGLTSHSKDFLLSIIDDYPFETIQFPYNILETEAEELFQKAQAYDIGIIVMKPLAGGAIDDSKLALKFILNNPNISVAIPGMASVEEVRENISVSSGEFNLEEMKKIEILKEQLGNDFCRRCGYCLPCTVGIDIPNCFMFEGYYNRYNLQSWAKGRYDYLTKHASDCIQCGKCETRCPYNLKIINKLKKVVDIFSY